MERAIEVGAEFLLSRDPAVADYPYTKRVSSTWFKFGFPLSYWSDVLEVTVGADFKPAPTAATPDSPMRCDRS